MILNDPYQLIARTYLDSAGVEHDVDPATIGRLRRALGTPPADAAASGPIVARPGQPVPASGRLLLEAAARWTSTECCPPTARWATTPWPARGIGGGC